MKGRADISGRFGRNRWELESRGATACRLLCRPLPRTPSGCCRRPRWTVCQAQAPNDLGDAPKATAGLTRPVGRPDSSSAWWIGTRGKLLPLRGSVGAQRAVTCPCARDPRSSFAIASPLEHPRYLQALRRRRRRAQITCSGARGNTGHAIGQCSAARTGITPPPCGLCGSLGYERLLSPVCGARVWQRGCSV